jgi:multiple sugar transport system substrate-binding protein
MTPYYNEAKQKTLIQKGSSKMRGKTIIAGLLTVLMLSSVLAGCGGSAAKSEERVKITFWDENAGPTRTPHYEELIKRFKEKNANIDVEYVGIPATSNKQKYDVAVASGDVPDIAGIPSEWIADLSGKGALLPLDDYYDKWSEKDKISGSVIQFNRSLALDKKLYQIPNTTNADVLWYRPDWTKEAGLNPPVTWTDFFTGVEKLTKTDKNQFGFSIRGGAGSIPHLLAFMYAYSGITEYFDGNGKPTINDPKNLEALKKYVGIYKKYTPTSDITNAYKEMVAAYDSGTASMILHNLGSYGDHLKNLGEGKFAAVALPKSDFSQKYVAWSTNNGYGIFKSSKHPEAAWKFLSFLVSADSQLYWNQNIGQLPTNTDALKSDWVENTPYIKAASTLLSDKDTTILSGLGFLPDYSNIEKQLLEPNFQKLMLGSMAAEEYLKLWDEALVKSKADFDKIPKK